MNDKEEEDEFEDDESEESTWEHAATSAVDHALASADFDDVQEVIILPDSSGDHRMAHYCKSLDELRRVLEEIYDEQWYGNAPFEGGSAVFDGDASGYVSDKLEAIRAEAFFGQFGQQTVGNCIIAAGEMLGPDATKVIRIDVAEINDELIDYLAKHPEKMRELGSRKFEELVAELFRSKGYEVEITPCTRDGGFDVRAVHRSDLGTMLIIIECKRYALENRVGVGIVRGLYGVVESERATKGIIATTSYFSRDAKEFHNDIQFRLGLADFDVVQGWLMDWKARRP
jgi:hypothetical protein